MTFKELSKELGISSSKLMSLENKGILRSRGPVALLGRLDDGDVRVIRLCCLFAMLGVPDSDSYSIIDGTADLKATLKKQVDNILSDDSNYSQAAIVMQNIRRECSDINELDPVPFLQHIKELKHSGGLFYDVNTGIIEEAKKTQNTSEPVKSKKFGRFFSMFSFSEMDEFEEEELRKETERKAEKEKSVVNDKATSADSGKASTADSGKASATDSDKASVTGSDKAGVTDSGKASVADRDKASATGSDKVGVTDSDKAGVTDSDIASATGSDKASVTDGYKVSAIDSEKEIAIDSEGNRTSDSEKGSISGHSVRTSAGNGSEKSEEKSRYISNPPKKTGTWNGATFLGDNYRDNQSYRDNQGNQGTQGNRENLGYQGIQGNKDSQEYQNSQTDKGSLENQEPLADRESQEYQGHQADKESQENQKLQTDKENQEYRGTQSDNVDRDYHDYQGITDTQENEAASRENRARQNAGYDESWSPYTNRGFGASNMGTGNWHGWTPGYGTYSSQIGTRARINNGEKTCPHPIRRFAARAIDTTMVSLLGGAIIRLGFRINISNELTLIAYAEIIFWLFEMMIEPLLLSTVGTTLGKWIMGISIRDMKTKNKLELKQAYIRSLKLAWYGFGLMIPIFTIFRRILSFARCRINDTMAWDDGIDVELKDRSTVRIVLVILILILLNVGDEIVSKQALIPKNRGEMTENQFYENVVEIMKYTEYPGDIPAFEVETRSGYVKSVTLRYSEEQTDNDRYNEMLIGFLAFAGASEDSNGFKLLISQTTSLMKAYYSNFQDSYCGINLNNTSDSAVSDPSSYSMLLSMLYGNEVTIPSFNQTFTMSK